FQPLLDLRTIAVREIVVDGGDAALVIADTESGFEVVAERRQPLQASGRVFKISDSEGEALPAAEVVQQHIVRITRVDPARDKTADKKIDGLLGRGGRRAVNSKNK